MDNDEDTGDEIEGRFRQFLFESLIRWDCLHAAEGMLVDIFSALSSAAAKLSLSGVYEQPANEAASINLRQDAMAMLNDSDGKAMSNWIRVFDTDVALFRDMARDWVRTCRETDVFHLFDGGNSHADF